MSTMKRSPTCSVGSMDAEGITNERTDRLTSTRDIAAHPATTTAEYSHQRLYHRVANCSVRLAISAASITKNRKTASQIASSTIAIQGLANQPPSPCHRRKAVINVPAAATKKRTGLPTYFLTIRRPPRRLRSPASHQRFRRLGGVVLTILPVDSADG